MAKRLTFSGKEIQVAEYAGKYFFHRQQVASAVGYKNSLPTVTDIDPIVVGSNQYLCAADLTKAFATATGERKVQCLALLHEIHTEYGLSSPANAQAPLADLDDLAKQWAKARIDVRTAQQILKEAMQRESDLFAALTKERNDE